MVDKVKKPKASKKKNRVNEVEHLIKQADKAKAGYDYPAALELYQEALTALEQEIAKNGGDETKQFDLRYRIHDGRARCYNLLAEANLEIGELNEMEGLATQMIDESRRTNSINRQAEIKFTSGDSSEGEKLSRAALELARNNGERDEEGQSLMLLSQIQFQHNHSEQLKQFSENQKYLNHPEQFSS